MQKKIIIVVIFIVLAFLGYRSFVMAPEVVTSTESSSTSTSTPTSTPATKPTPSKNDLLIKDAAWKVFEAYLKATKDKDIETVKKLSYQVSSDCLDQTKVKECQDRMNTAFNYGKQFKYENMKYISYDEKQIILAGDYFESLEGESPSFARGVLYFIREGSTVKFLSLNPFFGAIIIREEGEATTTVRDRLLNATEDTDVDYALDVFEKCIGIGALPGCVKTDSTKRDTNGDGFWDSTESLFYKQSTQ